MKSSKFSNAQKAFIIRQGEDGTSVDEVCRKAGISQATYFSWKKKYAGLKPSEMKRLRELQRGNERLKTALSKHPEQADLASALPAVGAGVLPVLSRRLNRRCVE